MQISVDIGLKICYLISAVRKRRPTNGSIAQLGEHLPYKQRVIGSSPIGPIYTSIYGGIAQLARARGSYPRCRRFKSYSRYLHGILAQLGEHLPYKQRVTGSSPVTSTTIWPGSSVG